MPRQLSFTVYVLLFLLLLGPFGVLPLGIENVNVYLSDIFVGILTLSWVFRWKEFLALIWKNQFIQLFFLFVAIAFVSNIVTPLRLNSIERSISFLYLARFVGYFSIFLTFQRFTKTLADSSFVSHRFAQVGLFISIIGWLQYFLYPDLRNLFYLGWDPHYKRIFATYFDPNYLGLLLVFSLILYLFEKRSSFLFFIKPAIIFVTLLFTYSRSSYATLLAVLGYYAISMKKYLYVFGAIILLGGSIVLLPRPGGEGVKLERLFSLYQRIENWRLGLLIFSEHPIMGVGFNTIRYAKQMYVVSEGDYRTNHSGAGLDNSFLFVAATTGIIGFGVFLILLWQLFFSVHRIARLTLVAVIVHSMFVNSLFFPWIMMWVWSICGANWKRKT
ncbi:O-antigen ligase family protein [Candidatus Gottesmanbacteria bacterium]|nr:O-antigen ligase family protein [Candidatus Gottesmanbacteria bacterium]